MAEFNNIFFAKFSFKKKKMLFLPQKLSEISQSLLQVGNLFLVEKKGKRNKSQMISAYYKVTKRTDVCSQDRILYMRV